MFLRIAARHSHHVQRNFSRVMATKQRVRLYVRDDDEFDGGNDVGHRDGDSGSFGSSGRERGSMSRGRDHDDMDDGLSLDNLLAGVSKPDWAKEELTKVEDEGYKEDEKVSAMTEEELQAFLTEHEVRREGNNLPKPITKFEHSGFQPEALAYLSKNFPNPTIIQSLCWPIALASRDLIGNAQTGSGKTLSFILPGLEYIKRTAVTTETRGGPVALVLAPTRELCTQIAQECRKVERFYNVRSVAIYGGADKGPQYRSLQSLKPEIIVATPGRLIDFCKAGAIPLKNAMYVVLDEADRMLDMGFEPQIRAILDQIRPDRQTTMYSATWPRNVRGLASEFFKKDHVRIVVGGTGLRANPNIKQHFLIKDNFQVPDTFQKLLETDDIKNAKRVLVFCNTKFNVDTVGDVLRDHRRGRVGYLKGGQPQRQREHTLQDFKHGNSKFLVATDVASRGLDIDDIDFVINYEFPKTIEDYIHRIGRTARGDKTGSALSFITPDDYRCVKDIIEMLEKAEQTVPDELRNILQDRAAIRRSQEKHGRRQNRNRGGGGRRGGGGGRGGFGFGDPYADEYDSGRGGYGAPQGYSSRSGRSSRRRSDYDDPGFGGEYGDGF